MWCRTPHTLPDWFQVRGVLPSAFIYLTQKYGWKHQQESHCGKGEIDSRSYQFGLCLISLT